jgi:hypothetical protein
MGSRSRRCETGVQDGKISMPSRQAAPSEGHRESGDAAGVAGPVNRNAFNRKRQFTVISAGQASELVKFPPAPQITRLMTTVFRTIAWCYRN